MYIKVYFDDKPLFLCDAIEDSIQPYVHHDDAIFIDELNSHTVKSMIHEMQLEKVHAGVFFHNDLEELKKAFFKKFTLVTAAGGLVMNGNDEVLLIYRKGKWDLPKGKKEKGEKLEDCALREVEEETGLKQVKLISPLTVTYHTYHEGSRYMLKDSHWFNMKASAKQQLVPQKEEDIHEIKWVAAEDLVSYFPESYPSIADVLRLHLVY